MSETTIADLPIWKDCGHERCEPTHQHHNCPGKTINPEAVDAVLGVIAAARADLAIHDERRAKKVKCSTPHACLWDNLRTALSHLPENSKTEEEAANTLTTSSSDPQEED